MVHLRYTSDNLINRKKHSIAARPLMSCVSFTCWQIGHKHCCALSLSRWYKQAKCQNLQISADLRLWTSLVKSSTFPLQSYFAVSNWQLSPIQVLWIWHRAVLLCTRQTHGVPRTWAHKLIFNNGGTKGAAVSPKVTSMISGSTKLQQNSWLPV